MSSRHYCSKCGVELLSFFKKGASVKLLNELGISKCKECDPKSWDRYDNFSIPVQRKFKNQTNTQWSKHYDL